MPFRLVEALNQAILSLRINITSFNKYSAVRWIIHGPKPTQPNPSGNKIDAVRLVRPWGKNADSKILIALLFKVSAAFMNDSG